jgi:preprotein translocase SecE subunit
VEQVAARPGEPGLGVPSEASENGAPDPLEHATPDAELAEAQLALGRPALGSELEPSDEEELEELATRGGGIDIPARDAGGGGTGAGSELAVAPGAAPERRPSLISRFLTFLRGSWTELQRVQWPDRRQTMQATGVVIGFVIVAGVYLGVADYLAGKLMTFILK